METGYSRKILICKIQVHGEEIENFEKILDETVKFFLRLYSKEEHGMTTY